MRKKGDPNQSAIDLGRYIVENQCTVRRAAEVYGDSKSYVHRAVTERLQAVDESLYMQVKAVLQQNRKEFRMRGAQANKKKHQK